MRLVYGFFAVFCGYFESGPRPVVRDGAFVTTLLLHLSAMSELLFDVNLQQMPAEYLAGDWHVTDRVLNRNDPASPLAQATRVSLHDGALHLHAPDGLGAGAWRLERDPLLSRPYLELRLPQEETRALITRLRRTPDGRHSQLSLYFQSGMELLLAQTT